MNKIRELLELPDTLHKSAESLKQENLPHQVVKTIANELQSALEAADLKGLVDRVEGLEKLSIYLYNSGYHAGHEDTVEGGYTDVYPEDMHTYHDDLVAELIQEQKDE